MKVLDVNVLVAAFRSDHPRHETALGALASLRDGHEPTIVLPEVALGFVRIVTRRGIFTDPSTSQEAMSAISGWCDSPALRISEAGPGRWNAFEAIMEQRPLQGGDVHDGMLAAAAIDLHATLLTMDKGFARFVSNGLVVQLLE